MRWLRVLTVLGALVIAVAGCTEVNVSSLRIGDCYNGVGEEAVATVETVECSEPHGFEVFAEVAHPAGEEDAFPGAEELTAFAEEECLGAFEGYVGASYDDSELFASTLSPDEGGWDAGDRQILCVLAGPDAQPRTESAEGSQI